MTQQGFWSGKRVFLTGHTGFKGGWLALWLTRQGAEVTGYALAPETSPSLHSLTGESATATSVIADIRDPLRLQQAMKACAPDVVFHLAAQPLVRRSYTNPVETYSTNVMGTVHLLEAVGRATRFARWWSSPATSATRTANGNGAIGRTSRWAATTRTATARAARNSCAGPIGPRSSIRRATPSTASRWPRHAQATSSAVGTGPKTVWCRTSCVPSANSAVRRSETPSRCDPGNTCWTLCAAT